jgi:hypothetical protein
MTTDMEDLTSQDLDRAHESLYYAARRYSTITEQSFLQGASGICPEHDPSFVNIGNAAADLAEAGARYTEAYTRWEASLPSHEGSGETKEPMWSESGPEGRHIFYEGDDPETFRQQINAEFGFDPGDDNEDWGKYFEGDDVEGFVSYSFWCPLEYLNAIYGSGRFPMGS